jgi:hypothetical protein
VFFRARACARKKHLQCHPFGTQRHCYRKKILRHHREAAKYLAMAKTDVITMLEVLSRSDPVFPCKLIEIVYLSRGFSDG